MFQVTVGFDLICFKCSPGGEWAAPSCSATLGQPVEGTKQASDHFQEEKIDVKSSRQCRHTRFYTGKNSYFYLILAYRPRSDAVDFESLHYVPDSEQKPCGWHRYS